MRAPVGLDKLRFEFSFAIVIPSGHGSPQISTQTEPFTLVETRLGINSPMEIFFGTVWMTSGTGSCMSKRENIFLERAERKKTWIYPAIPANSFDHLWARKQLLT